MLIAILILAQVVIAPLDSMPVSGTVQVAGAVDSVRGAATRRVYLSGPDGARLAVSCVRKICERVRQGMIFFATVRKSGSVWWVREWQEPTPGIYVPCHQGRCWIGGAAP